MATQTRARGNQIRKRDIRGLQDQLANWWNEHEAEIQSMPEFAQAWLRHEFDYIKGLIDDQGYFWQAQSSLRHFIMRFDQLKEGLISNIEFSRDGASFTMNY